MENAILPSEEIDDTVIERSERITVENATRAEVQAALKKKEVSAFRHFVNCKHCKTEFERNTRGRGRYAIFCQDKCKNDWHNENKRKTNDQANLLMD